MLLNALISYSFQVFQHISQILINNYLYVIEGLTQYTMEQRNRPQYSWDTALKNVAEIVIYK